MEHWRAETVNNGITGNRSNNKVSVWKSVRLYTLRKKEGIEMPCNSINSTIEILTSALLVVLLISTIIQKREKTKLDRLFLLTLVLHTVNTLGDLAAWRFTYKPGMLALVMTGVGNFSTYFFGTIAYLAFLSYVYLDAVEEKKPVKWSILLVTLVAGMTLFNMGLTLYNYKSEILYTIDSENAFTWGEGCGIPRSVLLVQIFLTAVLILGNTKFNQWKTLSISMIYLFLPFLASILEKWQPTLMLVYPAVAASLLLIYVVNQQKQEKQLIEKELELSDSRMQVMVSQIQPHFLYNSLNSIYHLCEMDVDKAQRAISDFSDYLRGNLDSLKLNSPVPFDVELNHLKNYLALEQIRFEDELKITYNICERDFVLPALSIQPLVENAVKYGVGKAPKGGTINITTRRHNNAYEVIVEDDGVGFDPLEIQQDGRSHIGIENVRQRLEVMCNGSLEIRSEVGKGTTAVIRIPIQ
ncbi:MAG: histidine kinase [Lachnospiraceae bacterium]|nr:histidine kinase [Lachnospiraceae bacterium]